MDTESVQSLDLTFSFAAASFGSMFPHGIITGQGTMFNPACLEAITARPQCRVGADLNGFDYRIYQGENC